MTNVLLSLTSIPRRLNTCTLKVLEALKESGYPVLISIPKVYKKWGESIVPNEIKNDSKIIMWTPKDDFGPATKLLGALEYVEEHPEIEYIITFDDDRYYESTGDFVKYMLKFSDEFLNCALTIGGIKLEHYPYRCGNGLNYGLVNCYVDVPAGYNGVLYPVKPFRENRIIFDFFNRLPDGVFNDDDAYFGIVLSIMNMPLFSIPIPYFKVIIPVGVGESAVEEEVEKSRMDNEMEIFKFAIKKKYLPNKLAVLLNSF